VGLDGVLEVVDVDQLNVKLVVEVLYFEQVFFRCLTGRYIDEAIFELAEFVAVRTQCIPPGIAFS
jgi:hypothetical protein